MRWLPLLLVVAGLSVAQAGASPPYSDWGPPENLGSTVNSASADTGPVISKDGLSLYFVSTRAGTQDISVTQRASIDDAWGIPSPVEAVNTSSEEGAPALSRDGHFLFFTSNRPDGFGQNDIWTSWRAKVHDDFAWSEPVNLGPAVNTAKGEVMGSYLEQDDTGAAQLFFSSNRDGGLGGQDIYRVTMNADGSFGPVIHIDELSSGADDARPIVRHDGLELFLQSARVHSGKTDVDLWVATRPTPEAVWSEPVNLTALNTNGFDGGPSISSDRETLYFFTNGRGESRAPDLFTSTRTIVGGMRP